MKKNGVVKKNYPTVVYKYGVRKREVVHAMAEMQSQLRLAHRYKNELTAIHIRGRERYHETVNALDPRLSEVTSQIEALRLEIETVRDEIKQQNIKDRRRSRTAEQKGRIATLIAQKRVLIAEAKERRTNLAGRQEIADVNAETLVATKAARAACGLYSGTYMLVEAAVNQARLSGKQLRFKAWRGTGVIGAQIQPPLDTRKADIGTTCVRIPAVDPSLHEQSTRKIHRDCRVLAQVRIGSINRKPLWAEVPITLHRPLPVGEITWAKLVCRKVATRSIWSLQLSIRHPHGFPKKDAADAGVVAINLGWRKLPSGLRVMTWVGDDDESGTVVIPADKISQWQRVDELQEIRDLRFNQVRDTLVSWVKKQTDLPEWFTTKAETLAKWRSQVRLASLVLHWRNNRIAGDDVPEFILDSHIQSDLRRHRRMSIAEAAAPRGIYQFLEEWRRKDKHLYEWQENLRTQLQNWRKDLYRKTAAKLRRQYRYMICDDMLYPDVIKNPKPEEEDNTVKLAKYYVRVSSPGMFREILKQNLKSQDVPADHLTQTCHDCGHPHPFDAANNVTTTCGNCGATWDQDFNHCRNLFVRRQVLEDAGKLLDAGGD